MTNFLKNFAISVSIAATAFCPTFASNSPDNVSSAFCPFSSPEEMVQKTLDEVSKALSELDMEEKKRLDEFNKIDFSKIDMDFVDQNFKRLATEKNIDEKVLRGVYFEPRAFWENPTQEVCAMLHFSQWYHGVSDVFFPVEHKHPYLAKENYRSSREEYMKTNILYEINEYMKTKKLPEISKEDFDKSLKIERSDTEKCYDYGTCEMYTGPATPIVTYLEAFYRFPYDPKTDKFTAELALKK
ncbi:MAG: hypothetical protein IJ599_04690 [Alphaproteobacteria bacterium]|nr:hypothetical protein [Alphaproteobacteria bacterium]